MYLRTTHTNNIMASARSYVPPSATGNASSMQFHVSAKHNQTYKSDSTGHNNRFMRSATSDRKMNGPRMALTQNAQAIHKVIVPQHNAKNFPTLDAQKKTSHVTATQHKSEWSSVVAKAKPCAPVKSEPSNTRRDPNLLYNKVTKEFYPDTHMFMRKKGGFSYAEEQYEKIRQQEYEEEMNQITGYDDYDNWDDEYDDDSYYNNDRYSNHYGGYEDEGFEESFY